MTRVKQRFGLDAGWLVVLAICLIALWPFLSRAGLPQQTDAELHVFRLHELTYLVSGGEIYPRWAPNFYHGYGYPIFNYYAPLTYYLGLPLSLLPQFDAVAGVKMVFILGMLLAAAAMYGFVRDHWGRPAGYVAAAVYLYSPYLQYVDPHARGVLAESFSFGLLPLALWSLDRLHRQPDAWRWLAAVLTVAAVILSHNLMALLLFGLLVAWVLWQIIWVREGTRFARTLPVAALLLGLGLAAFFWLPVILERQAVNLDTLVGQGDNYDFRTHFVSLGQLLAFSPRLDWGATEPAFRFNLGVAQWLLGGLGLAFLAARRVRESRHLLFFALSLLAVAYLMLPASTFLWERLFFLPFFQFPWRLLGVAAAMLAVLAGAGAAALLDLCTSRMAAAAGQRLCSLLTVICVALPLCLGLPMSQPPPWPDFGEVNTLRMSLIENEGRWLGTTSTADYVPATVDMLPTRNGQVVSPLAEGKPPDRVNWVTLPPGTTVATEVVRPLLTRYHVTSSEPFLLRLFLFDFPGWQVRLDGQEVATELGQPEGFIVVPVPAGRHVVEVKFGSTPARTLAWTITVASLLITLVAAYLLSTHPNKPHHTPHVPHSTFHVSRFTFHVSRFTPPDKTTLITVLLITALHLLLFQPLGWLRYHSTGWTAEPAEVHLFADFGEQIALLGYNASAMQAAAGEMIDVTLYWKAQQPLDINYQAFLHLLRADGTLATQSHKLNPGEFPTRRWPVDKYVRDDHHLLLPPDLPPGEYTVSVGLWVQAEGWRLPLLDRGGRQIDDKSVLFKLQVVE